MSSSIDNALHTFPIVQAVNILVVIISFPPVLIFLSQIGNIALHSNCKFLLRAWSSAFVLILVMHSVNIGCDLVTGKYIAQNNRDPPIRLYVFAFHGFAHAFSSTQELMLSIERAVSCTWPKAYQKSGLALRQLFVAEFLSVIPALAYVWQISNNNVAVASAITNSVDLASLICLSITTYYVIRRKKFLLNSSLNEKYQIKEAREITRAMLPCGVISLVMKFSSTLAAWIYALDVFDSQYMFTITAGAYFILASLNCTICTSIVLRRHAGLRKITRQMMCLRRGVKVHDRKQTAKDVGEIYFDGLNKDWR